MLALFLWVRLFSVFHLLCVSVRIPFTIMVFYLSGNSFLLFFSLRSYTIYAAYIFTTKPNICTKCRRTETFLLGKLKAERYREGRKGQKNSRQNETNRMHATFPSLKTTEKYVKHAKQSVVSHLMPHLIRIQRRSLTSLHCTNKPNNRIKRAHEGTRPWNIFTPHTFLSTFFCSTFRQFYIWIPDFAFIRTIYLLFSLLLIEMY